MPALTLSGGQSLALGSSAVQAVYRGSELKHFNPKAIPGLEQWYDAADLSTLFQNSDGTLACSAENDPVGYWADKSGNGRHARQSVNNNRPLLKLAARNGRAGIQNDSSNDFFRCDSGAAFSAETGIFVVRRTAAGNLWQCVYEYHASEAVPPFETSAGTQQLRQPSLGTGTLYWSGANPAATPSPYRRNGAHITATDSGYFGISSAALLPNTTDTNIISASRSTAGTVGVQKPYLFVNIADAGRSYPCVAHEVLIFGRILSVEELQVLERWLGFKWGISLA